MIIKSDKQVNDSVEKLMTEKIKYESANNDFIQ